MKEAGQRARLIQTRVHQEDADGNTMLHYSVMMANQGSAPAMRMVVFLLHAGADPTLPNHQHFR